MSDLPFGSIFGDDVEATNIGTVPPVEFSSPTPPSPLLMPESEEPTEIAGLQDFALSSPTPPPSMIADSTSSPLPSPPMTMGTAGMQNFGASSPSFSSSAPSPMTMGTTGLQGFGAPKAEPFLIPSEDDLDEDEEFNLEAIFKDFTPIGIGSIKRIVPIGEWLLDDPSVKALKRNLDEMGVTQAMPMVYANRVKHNIEKGYVQPDGSGFTEKGQQRAAEYLQYRYNQTSEQAMERASTARSLKIDQKRGDKAKGLNLKYGFGYQLDTIGRAVRN